MYLKIGDKAPSFSVQNYNEKQVTLDDFKDFKENNVLDPEYFPKLMLEILKISELIMNDLNIQFNHISIGGGYGIPYRENEKSLDFELIFPL